MGGWLRTALLGWCGRSRGLETTQALPGILGFKLWGCGTAYPTPWEDSRLGCGSYTSLPPSLPSGRSLSHVLPWEVLPKPFLGFPAGHMYSLSLPALEAVPPPPPQPPGHLVGLHLPVCLDQNHVGSLDLASLGWGLLNGRDLWWCSSCRPQLVRDLKELSGLQHHLWVHEVVT